MTRRVIAYSLRFGLAGPFTNLVSLFELHSAARVEAMTVRASSGLHRGWALV